MFKTNIKARLSKSQLFIFFSLVLIASSGCLPRGETITLDQSLDIAKTRFATVLRANKGKLPQDVAASVESLQTDIERLGAANSLSAFEQESKQLANTLRPLISKAGYPSRAALDQIVRQMETAAGKNASDSFAPGTAKLLAQRTYHVLAAEIESAHFAL